MGKSRNRLYTEYALIAAMIAFIGVWLFINGTRTSNFAVDNGIRVNGALGSLEIFLGVLLIATGAMRFIYWTDRRLNGKIKFATGVLIYWMQSLMRVILGGGASAKF